MEPTLPVVDQLAAHLRTATCKELAITATKLAILMDESGHHIGCHERDIRDLIARHYRALCRLVDGVIVAEGRYGYWIAGSADEMAAREALLWSLEKAAREKRLQFVAEVKSRGFTGILPDRDRSPHDRSPHAPREEVAHVVPNVNAPKGAQ